MNNNKTLSSILTQALEIIQDPKHWTQNAHARDEDGGYCYPFAPEAVCFCAVGALQKLMDYHILNDIQQAYHVLNRKSLELFYNPIEQVNDEVPRSRSMTSHANVIEVYEAALQSLNEDQV